MQYSDTAVVPPVPVPPAAELMLLVAGAAQSVHGLLEQVLSTLVRGSP